MSMTLLVAAGLFMSTLARLARERQFAPVAAHRFHLAPIASPEIGHVLTPEY
jgi:hypothetical protein